MDIYISKVPSDLLTPEATQLSFSLEYNRFPKNKTLLISAGIFLISTSSDIDYKQLILDNNTKLIPTTEVYTNKEIDSSTLDYLKLIENEETILTSIVDKMLVDVNSDYSDINKIIEDNFWDLI